MTTIILNPPLADRTREHVKAQGHLACLLPPMKGRPPHGSDTPWQSAPEPIRKRGEDRCRGTRTPNPKLPCCETPQLPALSGAPSPHLFWGSHYVCAPVGGSESVPPSFTLGNACFLHAVLQVARLPHQSRALRQADPSHPGPAALGLSHRAVSKTIPASTSCPMSNGDTPLDATPLRTRGPL